MPTWSPFLVQRKGMTSRCGVQKERVAMLVVGLLY